MAKETIPCIVCGKQLQQVGEDSIENQPSHACYFRTHGQYGSTVFDPINGEILEINVCDECLTQAGKDGKVLHGRQTVPVVTPGGQTIGWAERKWHQTTWDPDQSPTDVQLNAHSFDHFVEMAITGDVHSRLSLAALRDVYEREEALLGELVEQPQEETLDQALEETDDPSVTPSS